MVKVVVEIDPMQYETLKEVAKAIGVSVETLLNQEVTSSVNNACCWLERGALLRD